MQGCQNLLINSAEHEPKMGTSNCISFDPNTKDIYTYTRVIPGKLNDFVSHNYYCIHARIELRWIAFVQKTPSNSIMRWQYWSKLPASLQSSFPVFYSPHKRSCIVLENWNTEIIKNAHYWRSPQVTAKKNFDNSNYPWQIMRKIY